MDRRQMIFLGAAGVAAAAAGGAAYTLLRPRGLAQFSHCTAGNVAGGAIGGPFELVRQDGKTVTERDVIDRLSLVYFGYTFCPDVCPLDVARNADAIDRLAEKGFEVRPVFISVDPERDTLEVIREFVSYMHEDMVGLTGSEAQVEEAKRAYKAFGQVLDGPPESYLVNHSTFSYLMHPELGMLDFFRNDLSAETMAERIECFARAA